MTITNMTAARNGRNLELIIGGEVTVTVRPATAESGLAILKFMTELNAANFAEPDLAALAVDDALDAYRAALGDTDTDHPCWDVVQTLRDEEAQVVFKAAVLWNAKGGTFNNVQLFLADGDWSAALIRLLVSSGFVELD